MSVRQSLLAILDQGPCYGYQLRAEFERRTGATWPLNVGQIYNTLDRLERDGLVEKSGADAQGHIYWAITPAGSDEVRAWLDAPVDRAQGARDELIIKIALAATLPGVDAAGIVAEQRAATGQRLAALRAQPDGDIAHDLIAEAAVLTAEAELAWLDVVDRRLECTPDRALTLAAETPRRGRPVRAEAPSAGSDR